MTEQRSSHLRRAALGLACALAIGACGEQAPPGEAASQATTRAPTADDPTVTLITGDRVTLRDGVPLVVAGPDRGPIQFSIRRDHGRVQVVPSDAAQLIGSGQLDLALFDVTQLLEAGYGDGKRGDLPLIITGASDAPGLARAMTTGVVVDRTLPALHMLAVHQPKGNAGAALAGLRALAPGAPAGTRVLVPGAGLRAPGAPPKIWLDRVRKPLLDHSVPQIGGPAAHARGFTGAGITVAVLDTGVDSTHPDLAGKVVAAEDFTGDGDGPGDVFGHGTHVASIIAGTGAASNGQLAGVAPAAQLISGRICSEIGCPDSAILAGMEWAVVEQHAKIINMSLGGIDTPEIDPLEEAVNQLSAQFGALFVVAAGNDGADRTIESPGSADAALSVGAVDRDDQLASFSSRGPRLGDGAIKPEITAPGVRIVAARASGVEPIGDPVGDVYMSLSGTSMATPHVAGAAALLLQQHPDWTGGQLKAQLMASANPNPALDVFAQGAGRLDIDRGTRQDVTAEPVALNLGIAAFPHDDDPPLVRTVRYHNGGSAPVTLAFAASLTGPAGPGSIAVAPATVTVPAGASEDVIVTVRTDGDLADGVYSGALVATGGDVRVETPISVDRELESFNLTLKMVADGAPSEGFAFITAIPDGRFFDTFVDDTGTVRLPRGQYALDIAMFDASNAFLTAPRFQLAGDAAVTFDAALAKPVDVDVGDPSVQLASNSFEYFDEATLHSFGSTGGGVRISAGQLGGDLPDFVGWTFDTLSDDLVGSPTIVYNLGHSERGHVPNGWHETIPRSRLATVHAHHAGADDAIYVKGSFAFLDDGAFGLQGFPLFLLDRQVGPFDRTELFFGPEFVFDQLFFESRRLPEEPDFPTRVYDLRSLRRYAAGQHVTERWNQAPFGPAIPLVPALFGDTVVETGTAVRVGDQLLVNPSMFGDASTPAHRADSLFDHQRIAVFRDGVKFFERIDQSLRPIDVPPGAATYRYEQDTERSPAVFPLSTHVSVAWTFRSEHVAGSEPRSLPLLTMRFTPALDGHGETAARLVVVPIAFERPPFAGTPLVVSASLEVSFDDGAHWSRVPVAVLGDRAIAVILHPRGAGHVSLRGSARDLSGNQVEQTIIRAYGLRSQARQ